ncbi:MAG: hypothetical protein ACRDHM_01360 [Actinomycetota bacterium]
MVNLFVRRSSKVGLVLSLTLVIGLFLGVFPASASAVATASVNIHNVLAGQAGKAFTINVTNAETALVGKPIKEVRILPPTGRIEAVGGSAPGFAQVALLGSNPTEVRFRGGTIAPGGNLSFTIIGDITTQRAVDSGDNWLVRVSSDFLNTSAATGAGANALTTTVRQLQVQNVAVVSPTLAADDRDGDGNPEVTGTQGGVCVRTRVFNASAFALNVTPSLALSGGAANGTVGPARPATPGSDCSGAPISNGDDVINGGTSKDFDFLTSYTNPTSKQVRSLTGTAAADGASTPSTAAPDDVFIAARNIAVEPKADLTYVLDTLRPRAVVPGSTGKVFTISIDKRPAQSPPLPTVTGAFSSAFCNTTIATPTSLPDGQRLNQGVEFNPCNIANITDDRYPVTITLGYTDANGLVQPNSPLAGVESVRLDSLIPNVNIDLTPPASQVQAVPPTEPAVTDGQAFDVSGTVTDTDPTTDTEVGCGPAPAALTCTLDSVVLEQYTLTALEGGGGSAGAPIDITGDCSLDSSGNITCSDITADFAAATQSTRVVATATDEAGLPGEGIDALVDVDNVIPDITDGLATRGPVDSQRRNIKARFTEAAQDSNNGLDWSCATSSVHPIAAVTQPADKRSADLVTATDLHADVPNGVCTYQPSIASNPYHDRVGLEMTTPQSIPLTDGIEPLAPTFVSVNGSAAQDDGKFYFNDSTPEIVLSNGTNSAEDPAIADGYDVEVYKESNGEEGLQRTGDDRICLDTAGGDEITLSCDFGPAEDEADVYGVTIDIHDNVGRVTNAILVLDLTRPVLEAAVATGTNVTLSFSEILNGGSDVSNHWTFFAVRDFNGERNGFNVRGITAPARDVRVLDVSGGEYSPATHTPHSVRWIFDPVPELNQTRYVDRAGNELLDIFLPDHPVSGA